jgi:tetratricopeptide (TPR) repeat protein
VPSEVPSYDALDERAKCGFRRLALLGPVDVAEWVVAALIGEPDAADVVNVLVDRSLLTAAGIDATGEPRYRLHDLLRDYAAERVADEPPAERDAAMERLLAAYIELATVADRGLPQPGFFPPANSPPEGCPCGHEPLLAERATRMTANPIAWFSAERLNLLAVSQWACANGRYPLAAQLASRLLTFQFYQYRVDDADQVWRDIHKAAERAGDIATASEARFHLAWVMADRGRFADARAVLDKCIPILQARGVRSTLAVALYWRAFCSEALGHHESQRDDAERCLGLARQLHEPGIEAMALRVLGLALVRLGNQDCGIALCQEAATIARDRCESAWEYEAVTTLAFALCQAGRYESAEQCCQQIIQASQGLDMYVTGQAYVLGMLGDSYVGQRRYREGVEAFSQAMADFKENGDLRGQALCLLKLGRAHVALGEFRAAAGLLQQCLPMFDELGLPAYEDAVIRALNDCRPPPV